MLKLAVLHDTLPDYLRENASGSSDHPIEVAFSTGSLHELAKAATEVDVDALVVDLTLLGDDPNATVEELERDFTPEMTVIIYSFAKWRTLSDLRGQGRHLIREPVSMRALRTSMVSLIVRQMTVANSAGRANQPATGIPASGPAKRKFTLPQLTRLQEVRSSVDCECPNQVADLVRSLNLFEDYSHECKNRNAEDAKVHAMLAHATGHARAIMESALEKLCEHENIDPNDGPFESPSASSNIPETV